MIINRVELTRGHLCVFWLLDWRRCGDTWELVNINNCTPLPMWVDISPAPNPTYKVEFLALKWAVIDKLKGYLYSASFVVKTDNNPLTYLLTTAELDVTGHRCFVWVLAQSEVPARGRKWGRKLRCSCSIKKTSRFKNCFRMLDPINPQGGTGRMPRS